MKSLRFRISLITLLVMLVSFISIGFIAIRNYFKEPFKTGKRFNTDPFVNKVTNAPATFFSVPVFDKSNNIINVIFCVVDGLKLSSIATNHKSAISRLM